MDRLPVLYWVVRIGAAIGAVWLICYDFWPNHKAGRPMDRWTKIGLAGALALFALTFTNAI